MITDSVVDGLPDRELEKFEVKALEDHDRIDQATVEIVSQGTSHATGEWREDMVEIFWIKMDGVAHVLEFSHQQWVKQGEFHPNEVENPHMTAVEMTEY